MTTLEKIRAELHATAEMHEDGDYYLRDKWVDEIIGKYAEQEPYEDVISREGAIRKLRADTLFICTGDKMQAISDIEGLPSVRPQEQTGHWILLDECANSGYYCSECQKKLVKEGWSKTVKKIKFCPNCGVRMESEDKE